MATTEDTNLLGQRILHLGLIAESQLQEAWIEVGHRTGEPDRLLRALEKMGALTRFQSQKILKGETEDLILGGYRILYKIASGSFGRVYRADDPQTGRVVAIKILRRRWSDDEHTIELFEREGRVGLTLRHPNIVETLAVNRDPVTRKYYIVMEFVEGGNLRDFLKIRGKLTPAESLKLMEDAVAGIAHAYSRGVTHRDIKLTNVLISSQGAAKLVDFGLAGIFSRKGLEVETGEKIDRTVDYAGLEKATGVKSGDIRSDIYFLGCVLYEMLAGRTPLVMSKDPRQRMHKGRFDAVTPMKRDEVHAPPSVFLLVERMMALDPHQRFQTPSQLLDAVRGARRDCEGQSEEVVNAEQPAPKPKQRSVFVVQKDERIQDALRDKLKELGFRVFMAADPARAIDRFHLQPFNALVVDAGTTGEEGRYTFERIMKDADRHELACAGILILSEEQAKWADEIPTSPAVDVMIRPLTMKQLLHKLVSLLSVAKDKSDGDSEVA